MLEVEHPPKSLVVVGAGPIGVEMAQIFAALGSRVTLIEMGSRILAPVDEEIALALQADIERQGIALETGARIEQIARDGDGVRVAYRDAVGSARDVKAELVLVSTGRGPNVDGLGLERTAVRFDHHGINVDGRLETAEPGIYAVGDVVGQPMFAHWATAQAQALAGHLLGRPARFPAPAENSAVIFSTPEVGAVGLTEAEARAAGRDVGIARYDYRADARAQVAGHAEGMLKIVYDKTSRAVLGVHVLVEDAAPLVGEGALAVSSHVPVEALAMAIHAHPTLSEAMGLAARQALAVRG